METKNILASKTIWGVIIALLPTLLGLFGYKVSDVAAFTSGSEDVINQVTALIGGAVAIWGRVTATKNLVVKNP